MKTDLIEVHLADIIGRSPLNARPDDPGDDVSGLAATIDAVGLLQRISVVRVEDGFEVIAGWRRVKALMHLHKIGHYSDEHFVPAVLLDGTRDELVAASIAENTERRMLRPPEEAEAFAMLASNGRAPEAIARDFGVTVRHVKGRLKLATLCPEAMALWKADKLTLDAARLMSALDPERQAALIAAADGEPSIYTIRRAFADGKVKGDDARALYVGRDAYCEAGGRIEEYLFGEFDYFLDEDILDRAVREKLEAQGRAICEREGWGALVVDPEWNVAQHYTADKRCDLLDEENTDLAKINECREAIWNAEGYDEDDEQTKLQLAALDLEEEVIQTRSLLRAIPLSERAALSVFVSLDDDGRVEVQRAMKAKAPVEKPAKGASNATAGEPSQGAEPTAPQAQPDTRAQDCAAMAGLALENALAEALRIRPDLALAFLAACMAQNDADILQLSVQHRGRWDNDLANDLGSALDLSDALVVAANAPQGDLLVAVAALIAGIVKINNSEPETISHAFQAAALRGSAVREHMRQEFDSAQWFAKAPKDECIEAIVAIEGRNTCEAKKIAHIRDFAANLAADRKWLPPQIARHLPASPEGDDAKTGEEAPSLAQAMAAAIEADETNAPPEPDPATQAKTTKPKRPRRRKAADAQAQQQTQDQHDEQTLEAAQ